MCIRDSDCEAQLKELKEALETAKAELQDKINDLNDKSVALFQDVKDKDAEMTRENIRVKYIINDYNCGSAKKRNTVRSWLAQFQIPEEDEFFIRWNVVTVNLSAMVRKLEENNCSEHTLQMLWNAILFTLYVDYDTKEDFMPQFEKAEEYLLNLCRKFRDMTMDQRPDTDGVETAANDLEPVNM